MTTPNKAVIDALEKAYYAMLRAADEVERIGNTENAAQLRGAASMIGRWMVEIMEEEEWNPIETIPIGIPVEVKTSTGIVCKAKARHINRMDRSGLKARAVCSRLDHPSGNHGDVSAVGWRPL